MYVGEKTVDEKRYVYGGWSTYDVAVVTRFVVSGSASVAAYEQTEQHVDTFMYVCMWYKKYLKACIIHTSMCCGGLTG